MQSTKWNHLCHSAVGVVLFQQITMQVIRSLLWETFSHALAAKTWASCSSAQAVQGLCFLLFFFCFFGSLLLSLLLLYCGQIRNSLILKDLDMLGWFLPFFYKEDNFCDFVCFPSHKAPSEKRCTLKGKNLLPMGANSFLLGYTSFQKGSNNNFDRVVFPASVSIPLKLIWILNLCHDEFTY